MIGLIVTSENFTKIFLGEKWLEIVPVLMILAPIGMIQAIYTPAGTLYQSLGKVKIWFYWGVFTAIFFTIAFIIGLKWGILGVALAYLFANIITIIPGLYIPFQFIDLKLSTFEKVLRKNLALSLFMGVVIFIFDFAFSDYNAVLTFSATVIFGVLIYIPINIKFNKSLLDSIISLLKNKADKSIIDKTVIN
jgi:PST family polysaccharide transporter